MSNTSLRYSFHALDRMKERGLSKAEVRIIFEYGTKAPAFTPHGDRRIRWEKRSFIRGHEAKIIFSEFPLYTEIISVMWVYETEDQK